MGVNKVFSAEGDLSGIAGERGDFVIDKVFQKNIIDLNELGVQHEPPAPLSKFLELIWLVLKMNFRGWCSVAWKF